MYRHPARILSASNPETFAHALAELDRHVQPGGEAAGFLSYEAGYALEPKLRPLLAERSDPLCWFGLYDTASTLDNLRSLPAIQQSSFNTACRRSIAANTTKP